MHSIRKVAEQASTSSSQSDAILDIWIAALSRYKEVAGFDLEKERAGDYRGLEECNSPEDALRVIAGLVDAPHITKQTHLALSNVFRFVLAVNDAVAELAASLQIPGGKAIFVAFGILLKTVQNMQDRLSAVAELFFKFEQFFCRLDLRRGINYPVCDQEILTRICAEFLHVLALAQKIVHRHTRKDFRGRLQRIRQHAFNFREALLDNSDVKSAMRRLDELTHMELQITAAQTFQVAAETRVHVQNVQTMMGAMLVRYPVDSMQPATANSIGTIFLLFSDYIQDDREKALFAMSFVFCILLLPGPLSPTDRLRLAPFIVWPLLFIPRIISLHYPAILVDVMGERRPLYKEMWRTPQAFTETLRRFFPANEVLRIIDSHQYRIQDDETSVYEPGSSRVRSGTTLYMAAILFTSKIHCPWCSTQIPVSEGWNFRSYLSCPTCGRRFSSSSKNDVLPRDAVIANPSESVEPSSSKNDVLPRDAVISNPSESVEPSSSKNDVLPRDAIIANPSESVEASSTGPDAVNTSALQDAPQPADDHSGRPETSFPQFSFRFIHLMLMKRALAQTPVERGSRCALSELSVPLECTGKKRALLVGISKSAAEGYPELEGAHGDVYKMHRLLLEVYHYEPSAITILVDDGVEGHVQPTRRNILAAISELVRDVKAGDKLCFYYAGHSTQRPNERSNSEDGLDECMISLDGELIVDNELHDTLVRPLPAGSRLVAVLDTCNSGSLLDLKHYRCNRVPVPWVWRGRRDSEEIRNVNVHRGARLVTLSQSTGPSPKPGPFARLRTASKAPLARLHTLSLSIPSAEKNKDQDENKEILAPGDVGHVLPPHGKMSWILSDEDARQCQSPVEQFPCNGWCDGRSTAMEEHDDVKADVISLASCKDSQRAWESDDGESMTSMLVGILRENPDQSLKDVLLRISHATHSLAVTRHTRSKAYKKQRKSYAAWLDVKIKQLVRGNQSTASLVPPNTPPAIAARPTFPNATSRGPRKMINEHIASLKQMLSKVRQDKGYDTSDFQNPELSSPRPLDMSRPWRM